MATWSDFENLFPADFQPVIAELASTYSADFSISDYDTFAAQSTATIVGQLSGLAGGHDLLLGIATYYLDHAAGIPDEGEGTLGAWELMGFGMTLEDIIAIKSLQEYFDMDSVDFDDFQAMSAATLAGEFGPAHLAKGFWSSFTIGLATRIRVLADTEFGEFLLTQPLEERTALGALFGMLVADDPGLDQAAFAAMGSPTLAGKIKALGSDPMPRYRSALRLIQTVRGLTAAHCPDDQLDVRFIGSQGNLMTAGLMALQKSLASAEIAVTVREIGGAGMDALAGAINSWNSGHLFFHGMAATLLSEFLEYRRRLVEAAKQPVTPFAFQIRPTNAGARPLGGLLVKVTYPDPVTMDPVELGTRMLDFNGIAHVQFEGPTAATLDLTFEVMTAAEESLVTSDPLEFDPATEKSIEVELEVPALPVNSAAISALATALALTIPSELATYLTAEELATLDDLRRMGGLAKETDSAVTDNLALCVQLDNHAKLELVSDDAELREFLIGAEYTTVGKIAAKTRAEFVTELAGATYGEVTLAMTHQKAGSMNAVAWSLFMGKGASVASNYRVGEPINVSTAGLFASQCDCEECRSGVSPLAYLAALLDYGCRHLTDDMVSVNVDWFQDTFHQAFCEMPANCSASEKRVCQVRVAIEVLRQHLNSVDISYAHRKKYLETTYHRLLNAIGVSFDELRTVVTSINGVFDAQRIAMAERIGITALQVDELYLESSGVSPSLTEDNLELLFGFQSTLRNPFADGLKVQEGGTQVYCWQFEGVEWGKNTDADGYLYMSISNSPNAVSVYRNVARTADDLVGYALVSGATPLTAQIVQQNDSGLFGRIELTGTTADTTIKISVIPLVLSWRMAKLREKWAAIDWPTDNTYNTANPTLPIIEPDVMGPDDIRMPIRPLVPTTVLALDIFENRRGFVDAILEGLRGLEPDVEDMFDFLDSNWILTYDPIGASPVGTPPWDLSAVAVSIAHSNWAELFDSIRAGLQNTTLYNDAMDAVTNVLHLTLESFVRLDALYTIFRNATTGPEYSDEQLEDLENILTQAAKSAYYGDWIQEEQDNDITLTGDIFWNPIREPKEGRWDHGISYSPFYASAIDMPFIDPVEVGLLDLPDPIYGAIAIGVWQSRLSDIAAQTDLIYADHTTGYADMIDTAVAASLPFVGVNATFTDMGEVLAGLTDADADIVTDALVFVNEHLFLTETEFRVAASVMIKEEGPDTPTNDEYRRLAEVLVNGWRRTQWPIWRTDEDGGNLEFYWNAYKQLLPKWRSSKALRKLWLDGLAFYNRTPIVDPDLIKPGDIVNPEFNNNTNLDNPAYVLWRQRHGEIEGIGGWLDNIQGISVDGNLEHTVGLEDTDEVLELHDLYNAHKDVSQRLAQLNLDPERLGYIVKIKLMEDGVVTISDAERAAFDAIMLQVKKERAYGSWNIEERELPISLTPAYFRMAYSNFHDYVQYLENILLPWRTSSAARRDWQSKLESRIDHEQTMIEANAGVVKTTEDHVLIMLRDALIMHGGITGTGLEAKGEYLTERYLIDFRIQCCQETTRVAQAIETLQVLYFSIRTGLVEDEYPDLKLLADNFDGDWKWLGTYGTWRSLMFVYLYPENVVMPSLKANMSGKLRGIIDAVRDNGGLNPQEVCGYMHSYEEYLKDMIDLSLQGTVTTTVSSDADGCATLQGNTRTMYFHFALGGSSHTVYFSTVDAGAASAQVAQSHWEPVPELAGIERIVGATMFKNNKGRRYVYVFALKSVLNDQPELCVNRFDVDTFKWESDVSNLKVDGTQSFNVATRSLKLAERKNEDDPIYLLGLTYAWIASWQGSASEPYAIVASNSQEMRNRLVVFNSLNGGGDAWTKDKWRAHQFMWILNFDLVGAILTEERFLLILAAVQYVAGGNYHLAYHASYDGNALDQYGVGRLVPDADDFGTVWISQSPALASPVDTTDFAAFVNKSNRLRSVETTFADYDGTVAIIKGASGENYEWYYNRLGGTGTDYQTFAIAKTWYEPANPSQPSPGTLATSPQPNASFRSVGLSFVSLVPSNTLVTFLGPCFDYTDPRAATGAPRQKTGHFVNSTYSPMFSGVAIGNNPSTLIVLNLQFSQQNWQPLLEHPSNIVSAARKLMIRELFDDNHQNSIVNRSYLQEAYYLLPMHLALELQKSKFFEDALSLYRLVYDFTQPFASRKVYHGLVVEESIGTSYANVMEWLEDPENPHTIAGMRANTYTRFTIFSIVRCMLEMGDQEFTQDSPESVPRARTLYLSAVELLKDEIYAYEDEGCSIVLDALDVLVDDAGWYPEWIRLKAAIAAINNHDVIEDIVNGYGAFTGGIAAVFANGALTWEEKFEDAEEIYQDKLNALGSVPDRLCKILSDYTFEENIWNISMGHTGIEDSNRIGADVGNVFLAGLSQLTARTVEDLLTEDDLPWLGEVMSFEAGASLNPSLNQRLNGKSGMNEAYYEASPMGALRKTGAYKRPYIPYMNHFFCVPQNPVPFNLLLHAELNLFKIRHCRNIAGIHRDLEPYGASTDSSSGMPLIGAGGQIAFPGAVTVAPTPYRYEVVLARAKELVQLSQQAEGALLSALEKLDAEYYSLLRARQDLSMANASVRLQDLRIMESEHEVEMAELQRDRAQKQADTYQLWINAGLSNTEQHILLSYINISSLRKDAASLNYSQQITSLIIGSNSLVGETFGALALPLYLASSAVAAGLGGLQLDNQRALIDKETSISVNQMLASWEQRTREWTFQKELSEQDVAIGLQQIKLANDRLRITGQERNIALMQADHAAQVVDFLRTKFTNVELYDWMSGVLQKIYSFYLQHATSMAKIAQQQLAFERQEAPANLIMDDYWAAPSDSASANATVDRKGLTGSARLQMDLTKLDLYAFETEKRKLQLTKTMSMAQLFPAEFEVFRQTGVLTFRTQMDWFDRDFPGHYLRLIKRVRTSVIALVPPGEGIRARLSTTGVSRVVIGGNSFQTIVTHRGSESVSLTSPIDATGLFEMLPDRGDMLYPFEAMGVDALWEFRMQRAANPLNFNTIADVLLTFEYTALENFDYEKQVVQRIDQRVLGDRAFSLKYLFPDQWYDLHNHASTPHVVDLNLRRGDFPSLVSSLEIAYVTVMVIPKDGTGVALKGFELLKDGVGGVGTTNSNGVVSTRTASPTATGNNGLYAGGSNNWVNILGSPVGTWTLNCSGMTLGAQSNAIQNPIWAMLDNGLIEDIVLIVSYRGVMPPYVV